MPLIINTHQLYQAKHNIAFLSVTVILSGSSFHHNVFTQILHASTNTFFAIIVQSHLNLWLRLECRHFSYILLTWIGLSELLSIIRVKIFQSLDDDLKTHVWWYLRQRNSEVLFSFWRMLSTYEAWWVPERGLFQ